MKTIEIEDRVYDLLLRRISHFGESPSDVIEKLIQSPTGQPNGHARPSHRGSKVDADSKLPTQTSLDPLGAFLNGPTFLVQGNAIGKFLAILSWLCNQHPPRFEEVLRLSGRKRKYFARSQEELEASGNSVMPKRIPDTPYWVVSNSPTQLKKQIVEDVMRMLGYDLASIHVAVDSIR